MIYLKLFLSFVKIGFCSFGGMTMLPVIYDEVLGNSWMTVDEVLDIAAIAEMTPGSLGLNCATFVGLKAAGGIGALSASFGVMVPSLTLCMAAAMVIERLRGNRSMEAILRGIRPICVGMLFATAWTMADSLIRGQGMILWNQTALIVLTGFLMYRFKLSVGKTLPAAAILGIIIG